MRWLIIISWNSFLKYSVPFEVVQLLDKRKVQVKSEVKLWIIWETALTSIESAIALHSAILPQLIHSSLWSIIELMSICISDDIGSLLWSESWLWWKVDIRVSSQSGQHMDWAFTWLIILTEADIRETRSVWSDILAMILFNYNFKIAHFWFIHSDFFWLYDHCRNRLSLQMQLMGNRDSLRWPELSLVQWLFTKADWGGSP